MELNSVLVGITILFVIFGPIIYFIITHSASEKKVKKTFSNLAKNQYIIPNQIDIIGSLIIGIDTTTKKLVYSKKESLENNFEIIDLKILKDCNVKTLQHTSKTLDWIGLEILEGNLRKEIAFYIENNPDGILGSPFECLESAKRWEQSIRLSRAS